MIIADTGFFVALANRDDRDALSQGAGMQVVLMLPLIALGHEPQWLLRDVLMTLAWALNLAFAEWLIRRTPAGLVPAAG